MSNHLIIGLGGTGGKVLRELRKRIYEEYHSNEPGGGVYLNYIYLDSSPADLNDKSGWKVLGKSVHLGDAQKVNINGISTSMLQHLEMYPGLQSFISPRDEELIKEHMGPLITAGIGGQRRRLGRMLIANNLADKSNKNNFNNVLHAAVNQLQDASKVNDVTFHICAGLAGGTGSGSIVDVLSQIRKTYPYQESTHAFKIRLFLYMPEINMVYPDHDSGFYQANGYAALMELNAISTGKYYPLDVTGEKDVFTQEVQRLMQGQEGFEVAYIYSNVNEKGKILDLSSRLPSDVADFLFQTIVVANRNGTAGKMSRLVGCENDGAGPERDQNGDLNRSRKFMSFGITRIEYPETEIDEYVTYNYAIQATRQLTYNLWQEGIGYGVCSLEEVGSGFVDEIKDINNRERFKLSNAHLTLEKPIKESPNTTKWKTFYNTWDTRTKQLAGLVQQQHPKKMWLEQFTKLIDSYFTDNFRQHGVKKFFEIQQQELKGYAKHIRRHIETLLFNDWAAGTKGSKSILEIEKYAQILRDDCADRIESFKQQIAKLELQLTEHANAAKAAENEWKNIGWARDTFTNASSRVFSGFCSAKRNYYETSTKKESYGYAVLLLQEIIIELNSMIECIKAVKTDMDAILDNVVKQAESRCKKDSVQDSSVIKKYDADKVRELTKTYIINHNYQNENAAEIRRKMIEGLGEEGEHTFANLYASMDHDTVTDIILNICSKNARMAMENTAKNDPLMKLIGVNILDKLKVDLNSDEKIEAFVDYIIDFSRSYVQFNSAETSKVINDNESKMMSMVQIALPKAESEPAQKFCNKLIAAFQNKVPGFIPKFVDGDLSENVGHPNQIVVVYANAGFPLRYLENMRMLKKKYDQLLASPQKELNKMVLHTESFSKPLPPIFEASPEELEGSVKRFLLLAFALKLIKPQQDPTTDEKFLAMNEPDEIFGDNWIKLAKDFTACIKVLSHDFKKYKQLEFQVEKELRTQARSNDQKKELQKAVGGVVKQIILPSVCEGNEYNPKYAEYKALAMSIINNELNCL